MVKVESLYIFAHSTRLTLQVFSRILNDAEHIYPKVSELNALEMVRIVVACGKNSVTLSPVVAQSKILAKIPVRLLQAPLVEV